MKINYRTSGTCSQTISFDIEQGRLHNVRFEGGCSGNLQGIGALVEGMECDEAVRRLGGIRCGRKSTSCPDQLARAIRQAQQQA